MSLIRLIILSLFIFTQTQADTIYNLIKIPNLDEEKNLVVDPRLAYQITSMMEGVIQRGTAKKLKDLDVPIAGKTGTTNQNKDAWFIGYTPEYIR